LAPALQAIVLAGCGLARLELGRRFATPFRMATNPRRVLLAAGLLAAGAIAHAEDPPQPETVVAADEPACPPGSTLEDEDPSIRALAPQFREPFLVPGCPPRGCAGDSPAQARLNLRKSRVDAPKESEIDPTITLAALAEPSTDDRKRIAPDTGARIVGFVRHVWQGGVESANCRTTELPRRDTHIDLFLSASEDVANNRRIVTEVTPRTRALVASRGIDWSTPALKDLLVGHWVEITGWTFFDVDHCNEAANTAVVDCNGSGNGTWRQTGWEIHPVTSIRVLPGPPEGQAERDPKRPD
jgi:hypothetical protein